MQARQGDVFVESCSKPQAVEIVPTDGDRTVLAYGEATGHAHALRGDDALLYEQPKTKDRFLRVVRETDLLHEEHAPIRLPAGWYRVRRQREYTPTEIRTVAD